MILPVVLLLAHCISGQSQQLQDLENAIARVDTIVEGLAKSLRETQNSLDDLEQYGCHNCLIVHGCSDQPVGGKYPVFESYVTNKVNSELDLKYQIRSNDIDNVMFYHLGKVILLQPSSNL